jgi:hypothetical protein
MEGKYQLRSFGEKCETKEKKRENVEKGRKGKYKRKWEL